jgi:hypothetical protein
MDIQLRLPLRNISVNQGFGLNYLDFYKKMGLLGHNGVDFRAFNGFSCYASHSGTVLFSGKGSDGGIGVELWNKELGIKTIYYHFTDTTVIVGEQVQAGQIIGHCDNTGLYTTGDHLHLGMKFVDKDGNTLNWDNGFKGAVDPTPYFTMAYDGTPIKSKDCYKSNAYHRYFRKDRNLKIEIRILGELTKYLKRLPTSDQINACVYGAWERETIANPAMYNLYAFTTKGQYLKGERPFQEYGK